MQSKDAERLTHDHVELGDLLGQLIATLESNDVARSYATLDLFWARLAMHIRAEHLHLFPAIARAVNQHSRVHGGDVPPPDDQQKTIAELRNDHEFFMRELSEAIATMRELLANPEVDIAPQLQSVRRRIDSVHERLVKHNEIEEQGIYLWTSSLLGETERAELARLVNKELENTPPRFSVKTSTDSTDYKQSA